MKRLVHYIFAAIAFMAINASSCQKIDNPEDSNDPEATIKKDLRDEIFGIYYYWSEDVLEKNQKVELEKYDIYDCFDKFLYSKDRWSWMCDKDYYTQTETGVYTGTWGVSIGQPHEYFSSFAIYIKYIFPGSPFEKYGVTRGAQMTHIGGKSIEEPFTQDKLELYNEEIDKTTQTFTFRLANGKDTTFTATKAMSLATRSELSIQIFDSEDFEGLNEPVGYFNYLTYNQNMTGDIDNAITAFRNAGIKKAIIDLRYNGGGSSIASDKLINSLAPASAEGKVYVKRVHNKLLAENDYDEESKIKRTAESLELDRIYFITGEGSASASEMTINGLKPLTNVICVGDTTYGKPNGMYVMYYPNDKSSRKRFNEGDFDGLKYVYLPICFYNMNGNNEQIPDNGMIPNHYCPDDLFHDFNAEEANIRACLTHIVTGSFPSLPPKTKSNIGYGVRLLDECETDPHYGLYKVNL